jgi:hypothetical protein
MDIHKQLARANAKKARARRKLILHQKRHAKHSFRSTNLNYTPQTTSNITISSPVPTHIPTPSSISSYQKEKQTPSSNRIPLANITSSTNNHSEPHHETPLNATHPSLVQDYTKKTRKLLNISSFGGNLETRFANVTSHAPSTSKPSKPVATPGIVVNDTQPHCVHDIPPRSKRFFNIGSLGGNLAAVIPHASSSTTQISPMPQPTRPNLSFENTPSTSTNPNNPKQKRKPPNLNTQFDLDADNSTSSESSEDEYMDYSTASSSDDDDEHNTNEQNNVRFEPPAVQGVKTIQLFQL